jgi:gelsolin
MKWGKCVNCTRSALPGEPNLFAKSWAEASSLVEGGVFVLDKGTPLWRLNTTTCTGKEIFKTCQFVSCRREARLIFTVLVCLIVCRMTLLLIGSNPDKGGPSLSEFGLSSLFQESHTTNSALPPKLFRLSDASGVVKFDLAVFSNSSSADAFLLDDSRSANPGLYVWLGREASLSAMS